MLWCLKLVQDLELQQCESHLKPLSTRLISSLIFFLLVFAIF